MKVVCGFAFVGLMPAVAATTCNDVEQDIDYNGEDLKPVHALIVSSSDDCCATCNEDVACSYWTWISGTNYCYLKTSKSGRRSYSGRISGSRASPVPPAPSPSPPGSVCADDEGCNLAGACNAGACVCDAPWTGEQCQHLDFVPGPQACGLQDASKKETWGGSIIQENTSSFHMFTSYFKDGSLSTWTETSVVAHAWASTAAGPYIMDSDVLILPSGVKGQWDASTCHNPTIHRIGSEYVLFYIGMDFTSLRGDPRQTIGAAYSSSLWGPWQRMDTPLFEPALSWERGGVSNPGVLVNNDGSVVMFYRGNQDEGIGVTTAPNWRGPYMRRNNHESIIPGSGQWWLEDMYVWRNPRGGCHMVLHQQKLGSKVGGHIFTADPDCITGWRLAEPARDYAYNLTVNWNDGTATTFKRRERPQFIFTEGSPTPSYLAHAVEGYCAHGQQSCSIVVPLATRDTDVDSMIVGWSSEAAF